MATIDELALEKQKIDQALASMQGFFQQNQAAQDWGNFYQRPEYAQNFDRFQQQASGADSPFTPDVIASLIANGSGAANRSVAMNSDMIRRRNANAGVGGGFETAALANLRRGATGQQIANRREVTSRAQLSNYQARMNAQQQINSMLQQQLANQQQLALSQMQQSNTANQAQIGVSSQAREIGPGQGGVGGGGPVSQTGGSWIDRFNLAQATAPVQQQGPQSSLGLTWTTPGVSQQQQSFSRNLLAQSLAGY